MTSRYRMTTAPDEPSATISFSNVKSDSVLDIFLKKSGISRADVPDWKHIDSANLNRALSRVGGASIQSEAIEIPYTGLDGQPVMDSGLIFSRYRLLTPSPEAPKYLSRGGTSSHIYVPRGLAGAIESWIDQPHPSHAEAPFSLEPIEETVVPVKRVMVITEGEKKAELLVKMGIPAIAIAGCHMWADPAARDAEKHRADEKGLPPDPLSPATPIHPEILAVIKGLKVEHVTILLDSDGLPTLSDHPDLKEIPWDLEGRKALNPKVFEAGKIFAVALQNAVGPAGITVGWGFVPFPKGQIVRQGIDDMALATPRASIITLIDRVGSSAPVTIEVLEKEAEECGATNRVRKTVNQREKKLTAM